MSNDNSHHLPPLPGTGASPDETCAAIQVYLAVEDDLTPAQAHAVTSHLRTCQRCANAQKLLRRSTSLVANLAGSQPSAHVDAAVMAAIAARRQSSSVRTLPSPRPLRRPIRRVAFGRRTGLIAAVAVLVLALCTSAYFMIGGNPFARPQLALQIPANLSWDNYVLYYTQTKTGNDGARYRVMSYHDMSTHHSNIQYLIPGKMDVMVVKDPQKTLGLDMMHHVAQWDVPHWGDFDLSMFDLARFRKDLASGQASYEGKDRFKGQDVYRVRYADGTVLLLDMHYMPVNIIQKTKDTADGKPMYDSVRWLLPSQVSSSMWDMNVPADFTMGNLPSMP